MSTALNYIGNEVESDGQEVELERTIQATPRDISCITIGNMLPI